MPYLLLLVVPLAVWYYCPASASFTVIILSSLPSFFLMTSYLIPNYWYFLYFGGNLILPLGTVVK
jgi:hypothetical protein